MSTVAVRRTVFIAFVVVTISMGALIVQTQIKTHDLKQQQFERTADAIYATNTQVSIYFYGLTNTTAALTTTPTRMSILTPTARR